MTVRLVDQPDPRKVPSYELWTMEKNGRERQARVRILPVGSGLLELAIYETRSDGGLDILWSQTLNDGASLYTLAKQTQRHYEVEGWRLVVATVEWTGPIS